MNHFLWLDQIQPSHSSIVGDRALNLSLLRRQGNSVLPGGVVTSIAFEQFFASVHQLEPLLADLPRAALHLNLEDARQLQAIARQIRHSIDSTPLAADWLNQAWNAPALLLRPQVLLKAEAEDWLAPQICWAEPDAIATAVKRVWGEVFRTKSLLYWQRSHLPLPKIRLAVLVMPLSQAIASGRVRLSATEKTIEGQRGLSGLAGLDDAIAANLLALPPAIASPHYLQLSRDRQSDCLEQVTDPAPQPILDAVQVQQLLQFVQSIA
ncbi:MAG: hypothetical protein F6K28_32810, partial [Microcoleus sp. SIO2G3]|nr:hypothetical protein [Microcoleus sp. SIO2G3]